MRAANRGARETPAVNKTAMKPKGCCVTDPRPRPAWNTLTTVKDTNDRQANVIIRIKNLIACHLQMVRFYLIVVPAAQRSDVQLV